MNFLAHGFRHLEFPYVVAGTAVPDWLSVLDRRTRARSKNAIPFLHSDDADVRQLAKGIVQHHHDDLWFHSSRSFNETMLRFAVELRDQLPGDEGFRPSFVGHILVEILIDATLIKRDEKLLGVYYDAINAVSAAKIQGIVSRIANAGSAGSQSGMTGSIGAPKRHADGLAYVITRFADARFLYDYASDDKLLLRLNQVMARVGLPTLPTELLPWLADARRVVDIRCDELLAHDS